VNRLGIFLLGLASGLLISLISNNRTGERDVKPDFQTEFKAYDALFEEYMDQLIMKQQEIQQEIEKWKRNARQVLRPSRNDFRINQAKAGQVLELLNQGYNTAEVAQKLGLGIGEVELIRQLKNSEITH
jgi:preprotein translocase subunit Sss1